MLAYLLILIGAVMRVVPHMANFTPIAAMALFGGVYLKDKKLALVLPLVAMMISDVFVGFDSLESRLIIYGCFLLTGLIGLWVRNHKNVFSIIGGSVLGSTLFYLISNLVWLYPAKMYPHTIAGQIASYTNAIPFFRPTLFGDLFYVAIMFGTYELVKLWSSKLKYKLEPQVSALRKSA